MNDTTLLERTIPVFDPLTIKIEAIDIGMSRAHARNLVLGSTETNSQLDKSQALARELEADKNKDEDAWDERLRKLAKVEPELAKPE